MKDDTRLGRVPTTSVEPIGQVENKIFYKLASKSIIRF